MRRVLFILICILSISGLPLFGGENILENPGFEDGVIDPWEGRGCDAEVVTDPPVEIDPGSCGIYAGHAYNRSSAWMGITTPDLLGQVIEGETYTVGAYVRSDNADGITVQLSFQYDTGSGNQYVNVVSVDNVDDTGWVFLTGTYTIPSDLTSIYFYVEGPGSTYDDIYMDDAYVGIGEYERPGCLPIIRGSATNPDPNDLEVIDIDLVPTEVSWSAPLTQSEPDGDPNLVSVEQFDITYYILDNDLVTDDDPNFATKGTKYEDVTSPYSISITYEQTMFWRIDTHVVWDSDEITGVINDTVEGSEWTFTTYPEERIPSVDLGDVLTSMEYLPAGLTGTVEDYGEGDITTATLEFLGTAAPDAAKQMIVRTDDLSSVTADPNLLMDWIGTDTREVGNPLYLTLKGLPAGTYDWTSYHHDAENQTGVFDVTVYDDSGTTVTKDIEYYNGNSLPVATVPLAITSNGTDDVVLAFELQEGTFFVMNGFELDTTGGSVDPLYIDFGSTDANNLMTDYQLYQADHEVAETFTEQSYSAFSTTISIQPTWAGVPQTVTFTDTTTNVLSPTATLDADFPGEYAVQLSATDEADQTDSDTAIVTIAANACLAAQESVSWDGFNDYDLDQDCDVDIDELLIFVTEWLDDRNLTAQE